jgi:hypothetical protein
MPPSIQPLDTVQLVRNAEQADQCAIRTPPRLLVNDDGELAHDGAPQEAQPV